MPPLLPKFTLSCILLPRLHLPHSLHPFLSILCVFSTPPFPSLSSSDITLLPSYPTVSLLQVYPLSSTPNPLFLTHSILFSLYCVCSLFFPFLLSPSQTSHSSSYLTVCLLSSFLSLLFLYLIMYFRSPLIFFLSPHFLPLLFSPLLLLPSFSLLKHHTPQGD